MGMVRERYDALVTRGEISEDPGQIAVIARYDMLLEVLHRKKISCKSSLLGWFFSKHRQEQPIIKGLYIHGEVGRGKTMLMDLFFSCLPRTSKRRVHFNDFMNDVHNRINVYRQTLRDGRTGQENPFPDLAVELANEAHILCFDEFTVTDIADAMILSRLFTALFKEGVVLIATSNVAPDDLYLNGLNRQLFLPFIDTLEQHVDQINLDVLVDYRLRKSKGQSVYTAPLGKTADARMDAAWENIKSGLVEKSIELDVRGHVVRVPRTIETAARFDFSDLCSKPLAAFDYMALAARYRTFFIDHVPALDDTRRNETKRFILLIDTLYDHHVRLFMSAEAWPDKLYTGYIKTVETFEFKRTTSRLFEMQSKDYLQTWASGILGLL
ncbi:MAG: cell division protein ZapE [Candidatus Tokpelaia sp. JSC189]|nr:MAG: cell division protein ZapE [Candidatus Tokpelaia sp. JSC189]